MKTDSLTSVGISEKAAKIYLAGLALGTTSVQELARKTGLKRPTVYLHIDELLKQGLFETVSLNNKRYYRAAEPEMEIAFGLVCLGHERHFDFLGPGRAV